MPEGPYMTIKLGLIVMHLCFSCDHVSVVISGV